MTWFTHRIAADSKINIFRGLFDWNTGGYTGQSYVFSYANWLNLEYNDTIS